LFQSDSPAQRTATQCRFLKDRHCTIAECAVCWRSANRTRDRARATRFIVGAGAGALLGRSIDGGRNRTTGTIAGGVVGALLGRELGKSSCRR